MAIPQTTWFPKQPQMVLDIYGVPSYVKTEYINIYVKKRLAPKTQVPRKMECLQLCTIKGNGSKKINGHIELLSPRQGAKACHSAMQPWPSWFSGY